MTSDAGQGSMDDTKPNSQNIVKVTADMLPVHCPLPGTTLWNSHPRVYIPVEDTGQARCGYCGTEFVIKKEVAFDPSQSMIDAAAGLEEPSDTENVDIFGG